MRDSKDRVWGDRRDGWYLLCFEPEVALELERVLTTWDRTGKLPVDQEGVADVLLDIIGALEECPVRGKGM